MRKMKHSGMKWVSEIPREWGLSKIKHIAKVFNGNSISDGDKHKYEISEGNPYISTKDINATSNKIDYDNGMRTPIEDPKFRTTQEGATLLCIEGGNAGKKVAFVCRKISFVNKLATFEPHNIKDKFLFYSLIGGIFNSQFNCELNGLIGGVSVSVLKQFWTTLPPLSEQTTIANYLDDKCEKIDAIIEIEEKAIAELGEYKNQLAVKYTTKGLHKTKFKHSGIDWAGEVPEYWQVLPLFAIFKEHKNKNTKMQERNLLSLSYGKIIRRDINTGEGLLPENFEGYNIVEKGDIVLRLTDLQNDQRSLRTGLVAERGIITSAYVTIRNYVKANSNYLRYLLHSADICKIFYNLGNGIRQNLTFDGLKRIGLVLPPKQEQDEIALFLNKKYQEVDALIVLKHQKIAELKEYKKSLI